MNIIIKNQNNAERITRFTISLFLLPSPLIFGYETFPIVQSIVGGILLFNALSGMCSIYRLFGANTCPK